MPIKPPDMGSKITSNRRKPDFSLLTGGQPRQLILPLNISPLFNWMFGYLVAQKSRVWTDMRPVCTYPPWKLVKYLASKVLLLDKRNFIEGSLRFWTNSSTREHGGSQLKHLKPDLSGMAVTNPSLCLYYVQAHTWPLVPWVPIQSHLILGTHLNESKGLASIATSSKGFIPRITSSPAEDVILLSDKVRQAANLFSFLNLSRVVLLNNECQIMAP